MDIKEINTFFDYKIFVGDPQDIVDGIKKQASTYLPKEQINSIQKAYDYALAAHGQTKRLSGEEYIVHPLRATEFLMELKPDIASIQACILHDVIEDTPVTYDDIHKAFDEEIAELCEGLVKVSHIKYQGEDRQLETIKKTFLAMAKDLRVIFIKLADRIHNIQTLHYHPQAEKQKKIATETMKIYVPITKKLGLYHYQLYLENGCFNILYPNECARIVSYLHKTFGSDNVYLLKGAKKLAKLLEQEGITGFSVKGRLKSPYRIWEKMEKKYQSHDLSNVMDMLAYRVMTKDMTDAYLSLGIIHKYFTPMIKKIKDYIAVPKFNGYRSLHTTVLGMFRFPVEIQIRTYEMDQVAEFGVAAHFAYSDNSTPTLVSKSQSDWIEKLQTIVNQYKTVENKESFKKELNIELLNKATFLYTPKGDVIELPRGGSVLDFAFHIHSDIGLRFKNALVNWEIKPISYIPKTGDVLMIQTRKNKYTANKHRLDYLHTPSARGHLLKYLKSQEKDSIVKQITIELNKKLKQFGLPTLRAQGDKLAREYSQQDLERKLIDIHDKKLSINKLIHSVYEAQREEKIEHKTSPRQSKSSGVIIDGDKILNYVLCPECQPKTKDKIIARSGRQGIKIHKTSCKALRTVSLANLLEAHREGQEPNRYLLGIVLSIPDKYGSIMHMMEKLSELNLYISHMNVQNLNNGFTQMTIEIAYDNPAQISLLLQDLKKQGASIQLEKQYIS